MKKIKETDFPQLFPGQVILIGHRLEVVQSVLAHTFYSSPLLPPGQPASHWAGSLEEDEDIIIFEGKGEVAAYVQDALELMDDSRSTIYD